MDNQELIEFDEVVTRDLLGLERTNYITERAGHLYYKSGRYGIRTGPMRALAIHSVTLETIEAFIDHGIAENVDYLSQICVS